MAEPLRIVLCVNAVTPNLTGIGRYNLELANGVRQDARVNKLLFLHGAQWVNEPAALVETAPRTARRGALRRRVDNVLSQRAVRRSLVHGPNYFLPDGAEWGVVTVHDLSVFHYPETHPVERLEDFDRRFARTMERARHVITDSISMRDEILQFTGRSPADVTSVALGVSRAYAPHSAVDCTPVLRKYGVDYRGYALCVSSLEPRKKIEELINAWRRLPMRDRLRTPLVLAGAKGWRNERLMIAIQKAQSEGWLISLGYVPEEDLPFLYAGSTLFLYPSIYEGFGLPPIEAMASGVPAIVSEQSCLPSVTRGAAMPVDPNETDGFARAIERGLTDDRWRASAIEAGLRVAGGYTWERCVEETVNVYQKVWAEHG